MSAANIADNPLDPGWPVMARPSTAPCSGRSLRAAIPALDLHVRETLDEEG